MTLNLNETVQISRPLNEVFDYVTDPRNDPDWQLAIVKSRYTSEGPIAVGSTGVHQAGGIGITMDYGWELIEYEESRRIAWKFTSGPFKGSDGYVLEPTLNGTQFTRKAELNAHGIWWFISRLGGGMLAKQVQSDLQNLKRILESPSHQQTSRAS